MDPITRIPIQKMCQGIDVHPAVYNYMQEHPDLVLVNVNEHHVITNIPAPPDRCDATRIIDGKSFIVIIEFTLTV